jgi:tetratricopeptide (TPR) repeat protein
MTVRSWLLLAFAIPVLLTGLFAMGGGTLPRVWQLPKSPVLVGPIAEDSELWRLMQAARTAEDAKDYTRAVALYTAALKIEPGPNVIARDLHAERGSVYNYLGLFKEAYADYDAALNDGYAIATDRTTARWYMGRGFASLNLAQYRRALDDFDIVLREVPDASNALAWRGAAYQGLGNREKAIADYKAALAIDPNKKRALDELKRLERR